MSLDALLCQEATDRFRSKLAETKIVRRGSHAIGVAFELNEKHRVRAEPSGDVEQRRAGHVVEGPLVNPKSQHDRLHDRPFPLSTPEPSKPPGGLVRLRQSLLRRG